MPRSPTEPFLIFSCFFSNLGFYLKMLLVSLRRDPGVIPLQAKSQDCLPLCWLRDPELNVGQGFWVKLLTSGCTLSRPAKAGLGFWGLETWGLTASTCVSSTVGGGRRGTCLKSYHVTFPSSKNKTVVKNTDIDWICIPSNPKFIYWNLITNVMVFGGEAFGRWLDHEGGVLIREIRALMKEAPESSLTLLPCEVIAKDSHLWTKKWALTRHRICLPLDLGLPRLQNCEK